MSLYSDIRGALQARALTASGFPSRVSYQGVKFDPNPLFAWARMTLVPNEGRSAVVGAATKLHRGLFIVTLFYPTKGDPGTKPLDDLVNGVAAVFGPGTSLTQGSETVTVDYAERGAFSEDPEWLSEQVTVAYRCFSPNN